MFVDNWKFKVESQVYFNGCSKVPVLLILMEAC